MWFWTRLARCVPDRGRAVSAPPCFCRHASKLQMLRIDSITVLCLRRVSLDWHVESLLLWLEGSLLALSRKYGPEGCASGCSLCS